MAVRAEASVEDRSLDGQCAIQTVYMEIIGQFTGAAKHTNLLSAKKYK